MFEIAAIGFLVIVVVFLVIVATAPDSSDY